MIHSSDYDPRVYPYKGVTVDSAQIDRVQEMTASVTLNRTIDIKILLLAYI